RLESDEVAGVAHAEAEREDGQRREEGDLGPAAPVDVGHEGAEEDRRRGARRPLQASEGPLPVGGLQGRRRHDFPFHRMTPSFRNFWKIMRTSSSFMGEIFMMDFTSHWPLMRDSTKPSAGVKGRSCSFCMEMASSGTLSPETPSVSRAALISFSASRSESEVRPSLGSSS